MEGSAIDFGVILHEEVLLDNPPPSLRNVLVRLRVFLRHIFPSEKGPVLADRVNLGPSQNRFNCAKALQ